MTLYSPSEQIKIVNYIVQHNAYHLIKGDRIWKNMAQDNIVNRTWQSLKQHFRKKIIWEVHYPKYKLDVEKIDKLRFYFKKTDPTRKNTSRKPKKSKKKSKNTDVNSDSDSDSSWMENIRKTIARYESRRSPNKNLKNNAAPSFIHWTRSREPYTSFRLDTSSSKEQNNPVSVKNELVHMRNVPVYVRNAPVYLRNEPVHVKNEPENANDDSVLFVPNEEPVCIVID